MGQDLSRQKKIEGAGLRFEFDFSAEQPGKSKDLGWGHGRVFFEDTPIWYGQEEQSDAIDALDWTWIDLLEFLSNNWSALRFEKKYPFNLTPSDPFELRSEALERWRRLDLAVERRKNEDGEICQFETRHDLARGMRGIYLPSIFLVPEGAMHWVCVEEHRKLYPSAEVLAVLSEVGGFIAAQLAPSNPGSRAHNVLSLWRSRDDINVDTVIDFHTGLARLGRQHLQGKTDPRKFWEISATNPFQETEVQAAARMTGGRLAPEDQREVISAIRKVGKGETNAIDALAKEARDFLDARQNEEPYRQGYALAQWLREKLGLSDIIDPNEILAGWKVSIVEIELKNRQLDAIACWGPLHGPTIFLNRSGVHAATAQGRSSTLAHEICHLVADRSTSLPLAEVFGGTSPSTAEKRAKAFAAELLIPQALVAAKIRNAASIEAAVSELRLKHNVGFQLIGWQIYNGPVWDSLKPEEKDYVESLASPNVES